MTVQVHLEFKRTKKQLTESFIGKNKKSSKKWACLLMLKAIYFTDPRIWDYYQGIKQQKNFVVEKNPHQVLEAN